MKKLLSALLIVTVLINYSSQDLQEKKIATVNQGDKDPNEPELFSNPIPIVDNSTNQKGVFDGNWYKNIAGILEQDSGYRVYFENTMKNRVESVTSTDLKEWSEPVPTSFPLGMSFFYAKNKIYCYTEDDDRAYLWDEFHTEKGCQNKLWKMYEWNLDGTLPPSYIRDKFIQYGRVRGISPQNEGGWGNDDADYPDPANYPKVSEAFKEFPNYDAENWIQDRRGLSIHTSQDGRNWESRILADPESIDLEGFLGWKNEEKNGIADFYSAVPVDENRLLLKVFWKEKDRLVDRTQYVEAEEDFDIRRRFRFTGETTIIPAVITNGVLKITSTESVIPYEFHARKAHPEIFWATAPGTVEVGQMTPANHIIEKEGNVYFFYHYRDDVHYERHPEYSTRILSGIFIYRMQKEEFDALFR